MRLLIASLLLQFLIVSSTGSAQVGSTTRVVELKGGETVVLHADGLMTHFDASGKPVAMPDGSVMVAKDGSRVMMKGKAFWREVLELAATHYAQATTGATTGTRPNVRSVQLKDGGRIVLSSDGAMAHFDAAGNRRRMADGEVMMAADGSQILMVNGTLWTPETKRSEREAPR